MDVVLCERLMRVEVFMIVVGLKYFGMWYGSSGMSISVDARELVDICGLMGVKCVRRAMWPVAIG